AGFGQAVGQSPRNRVAGCHDDGYSLRRLLSCLGTNIGRNNYDVDLKVDQFSGQYRKSIFLTVCVAIIKGDIFALHISTFPQALLECLQVRLITAADEKYPDARDFTLLLSFCRKAKRKEHGAKSHPGDFSLHAFPSAFLSLDT